MATPYTVARTTTIDAPAESIRSLLHDFHLWPQWSPWEDLDPDLRRTYSGADAGVGAHYAWEGNRRAGKGAMTVTADDPGQVDVGLRFDKPFPADNRIEFVLTPTGERSTVVEWRMHGETRGVMRVFTLVRSMDAFIGPDFEKGLARLKVACETG